MLHYIDFIIYLWLVPIILCVFFPIVLLITVGLPLTLIKRTSLFKLTPNKEKRRQPRFSSCKNIFAEITVGETTCTALVSDISQMGISLKRLPERFSYKINKLSVVIRQYGVDYNLLIKTKWVALTETGKQIGAEIDMASPEWSQFLLHAERQSHTDPV